MPRALKLLIETGGFPDIWINIIAYKLLVTDKRRGAITDPIAPSPHQPILPVQFADWSCLIFCVILTPDCLPCRAHLSVLTIVWRTDRCFAMTKKAKNGYFLSSGA